MKEKVAQVLAERVKDGDVIGIGSGSTVELALRKIGERVKKEKISVSGVASSFHAGMTAIEAGIRLLEHAPMPQMSWGFDGADEVDAQLNMIKGNGAAMFKEKVLARSVGKLVIVVTEEKVVTKLGTKFPVPVEVIPTALLVVEKGLKSLGCHEAKLRRAGEKEIPVITEQGNFILDCKFSDINPALELKIKSITGVVESGLFIGCASEVIVAKKGGVFVQTLESGKVVERSL